MLELTNRKLAHLASNLRIVVEARAKRIVFPRLRLFCRYIGSAMPAYAIAAALNNIVLLKRKGVF